MTDVEPIAFLNDQRIPAGEARLPVSDVGVVHGVSVTEFLRTFGGKPFCVKEHLARLFDSATGARIKVPACKQTLAAQLTELVKHNYALLPSGSDLGVIVFVTGGPNVSYLGQQPEHKPTLCLHSFPLRFELWAEKYQTGQRLLTTSRTALPAGCVDPRIKSRSRLHWALGDADVRERDPQAAAIWKDERGCFTETAAANIAFVIDGSIVTPAADRTLNGVSRQFAERLAVKTGIAWQFGDVTRADLQDVSEVFLMSTPYCLLPVASLDDWQPTTTVGESLCARLLNSWSDEVGVNIAEQARQQACSG